MLQHLTLNYCVQQGVRSEVLTAYSEEYEVTQPCKELEFLMENIPGYRNEWIRYIYFEFTKAEFIKSYQNIIMKKKVPVRRSSIKYEKILQFAYSN